MREIGGKTLLKHLIERINLHKVDWPIIICTSTLASDNPIQGFCEDAGVECFRGSHLDVASRLHEACQKYNLDAFLRISADSPMIDGSLVAECINCWNPSLDFLSNIHPRTYPKGQSIEIINSYFFSGHISNFTSDSDREHVTSYFYRNLELARFKKRTLKENLSHYSLAIDTPEDLKIFKCFVNAEGDSWIQYGFKEILQRYPFLPEY